MSSTSQPKMVKINIVTKKKEVTKIPKEKFSSLDDFYCQVKLYRKNKKPKKKPMYRMMYVREMINLKTMKRSLEVRASPFIQPPPTPERRAQLLMKEAAYKQRKSSLVRPDQQSPRTNHRPVILETLQKKPEIPCSMLVPIPDTRPISTECEWEKMMSFPEISFPNATFTHDGNVLRPDLNPHEAVFDLVNLMEEVNEKTWSHIHTEFVARREGQGMVPVGPELNLWAANSNLCHQGVEYHTAQAALFCHTSIGCGEGVIKDSPGDALKNDVPSQEIKKEPDGEGCFDSFDLSLFDDVPRPGDKNMWGFDFSQTDKR